MNGVVICDWDLIKETFIKDGNSYTGRPVFPINNMIRSEFFQTWDFSIATAIAVAIRL